MVLTTRRRARLQEASVIDISTPSPQILSQEVSADEDEELNKEASSSSSSSSDEGISSEDGDDDDELDSNDGTSEASSIEEEDIDIDAIFADALEACQAQDAKASAGEMSAFETSADRIGIDQQKGLDVSTKPEPINARSARQPDESMEAHFDRLKRGDDLGKNKPKAEARLRRERQREKEKTAGSEWFDMPAFPKKEASGGSASSIRKGKSKSLSSSLGPTADEMTKQIQAIRLRNAMDPKRFYRGGNGVTEKGMPAFAQMGRIISSNTEPASTMSRSERGRTVIDELIKDAQNAAYTKRKFSEQQSRTDIGGSSHIKKRKGNNAGKKQRR